MAAQEIDPIESVDDVVQPIHDPPVDDLADEIVVDESDGRVDDVLRREDGEKGGSNDADDENVPEETDEIDDNHFQDDGDVMDWIGKDVVMFVSLLSFSSIGSCTLSHLGGLVVGGWLVTAQWHKVRCE